MSYYVRYAGTLKFKNELSDSEFVRLESLYKGKIGRGTNAVVLNLSEIVDEYAKQYPHIFTKSIDELFTTTINGDETGIEAVDTYAIPTEELNAIILFMRKKFPDFGLIGEIKAQGENIGDVFTLYVGNDGFVHVMNFNPFISKVVGSDD